MELKPRGKLTDAQLSALEKVALGRLPPDYRAFLRDCNGGQPSEPCLVAVPGLPGGGEADVQLFYGWETPLRTSDLRWALDAYIGRIPVGSMPIACDSGGGVFCIILKGPAAGSVVFCDMGNLAYNPDGAGGIHHIAATFRGFVTALAPIAPQSLG